MKTMGPPSRDRPIEIVHFADPWCWWSWGLEPILQRLREVYGDNVKGTYKMGGEFETLAEWMRENGVDERGTADWILESVALMNMPVRPDYYFRSKVESSFPACRAFKAAELQSRELAAKYFRRMVEAFGLECLPATDETLVKLGAEVGLDKERLRKDTHSDAVEDAFERDREEMARAHANFDALLIRNRQGQAEMKGATFTSKPFEDIVDKLAPGLPKRSPADILEYLEHHRDVTTANEIASVFRIGVEDAEIRLFQLERAGFLTDHDFEGIEAWRWKGTKADKLPLEIAKISHVPPKSRSRRSPTSSRSSRRRCSRSTRRSRRGPTRGTTSRSVWRRSGTSAIRKRTCESCRRRRQNPSQASDISTPSTRFGRARPCSTSGPAPGRTCCSRPSRPVRRARSTGSTSRPPC